ncbi:MAG: hypothetical protein ACYDEP_11505 [Acidimicrobiales bacterium]
MISLKPIRRPGGSEKGQTAMMLALLMVIVMVLLPLGVLIIAQSQPAVSAQELSSQQALQAAQNGLSAYQVWINTQGTGNAQSYCSGGYAGLSNGWTCNSGKDSRTNNDYYPYSDASVPGFVNCFSGTGNSGVLLQGNSGSSCVSQPQCPSSSYSSSGWQTISGSSSGVNTGYQFVVDSSAVQNSTSTSGSIYIYATGRSGVSGNYVCRTAKTVITDTLPKPQKSETLTTDITTCGSNTPLPTPNNATSANVTLAGGNGSPGGPGAYPFTGTAGGGGDGAQMTFTLSITSGATYTVNAGCGATGTGTAGAGTGFASGGAGGNDGGAGGGASALCVGVTNCTDSSSNTVSESNLIAVAGGGGGGGEGDGWFGVGGTGGCAGGVPSGVPCQSPVPTFPSIAAMTSGGGGCGVDIIFFGCIAGAGGQPVSNTTPYTGVGAAGAPGQTGGADGGGGGGGFIGGQGGQQSSAFFGWGFGGGGGSGGTSWVNPSTSVAPVSGLTWSNNTLPAGSPGVSVTFSCSGTCTFPSGSPYSATGSTFSWPAQFSCGGSDPFAIQPPNGASSFTLTVGVVGANGGAGGTDTQHGSGPGGSAGAGQGAIAVISGPVQYNNGKAQPQDFSVNLGCNGAPNGGNTTSGFSQGGASANPGATSSGAGGGSSGICIGSYCSNGTTSGQDVLVVGAGGGGGGENTTDSPAPQSNYTSGGNSIDDNNSNESLMTMDGGQGGGQMGGDGVNCDGSFVSQPCVNDGGSPNHAGNNGGPGSQTSTGADGGGGGGGYNTSNSGGGVGAAAMGCIKWSGWFSFYGCGGGPGGQGGWSYVNTNNLPDNWAVTNPCYGPAPLSCDNIKVTGATISGTIQFTSDPNGASISTLASGLSGVNAGASTTSGPAW